ncbi:MAG: hypothetical protein CSA89_00450 [Bacteroidales bacterium]|nr:MAG: hypothetical protein CSA89_00450 [Bacteroidales bacterium]
MDKPTHNSNIIEKVISVVRWIISFLTKGIWEIGDKNLSQTKSLLLNLLRKIILSIKGFYQSQLMIRSTSLSFYTVMAFVPTLAIFIAIGRGFGMSERVKEVITEALSSQSELVPYITQFIDNYLSQISGGVFIGVGVLLLIWSVIGAFREVEANFNKIWNVEKSRSLFHQFTTYTTLILLIPILISLSSGFSIYINRVHSMIGEFYSPLNNIMVSILPYFFYWILFTLLYYIIPNTKVRFIHALFAGVICGTIFQIFQYMYINGQINLSKYNSVYGTFAALPLFFVWLQFSWLILLYGAELSFVSQNLKEKYYDYGGVKLSRRFSDFVLIAILNFIIKQFENNAPPISAEQLAMQSNIPIRVVFDSINRLINIRLVVEVTDDDDNRTYIPAMDINKISVGMLLDRLEKYGRESEDFVQSDFLTNVWEMTKGIKGETASVNQNILIKDL